MTDWTKRFAVSALAGFLIFVFAVPLSCSGFVLLNEHRYGDVDQGGPAAILSALGLSALLALGIGFVIWRKTRPR